MRRASITLTDDLERDLEAYLARHDARPSLTAVVQAALRKYLADDAGPSDQPMTIDRVLRLRKQIKAAAAEHGARRIWVFGSVARGEASDKSDADFLVAMEPGRTLFDLARMRGALEGVLGVAVDVVTDDSLEGDLADEIFADAVEL